MKRLTLLLLLAPSLCCGQLVNLALEGAGIRGLAYCGALEVLSESGQLNEVERVAGTSAGAIVGALLAVGYSADEIGTIVANTDFEDFNDGDFFFIGGTDRVIRTYGWYPGDVFVGWLESHVARKTGDADITFRQLHDRRDSDGFFELFITATNLTRQRAEVFSHETRPDMRIVDAVRVSMSVPFWFTAVHLDEAGRVVEPGEGDVYVDGGILMNYPLRLFDEAKYYRGASAAAFGPDFRNPQTLGLRMETPEQLASDAKGEGLAQQPIDGVEDYVRSLYVLVMEELNRRDLTTEDWERTVTIDDTNLGPRVKQLSPEQKEQLLSAGRSAANAYLSGR